MMKLIILLVSIATVAHAQIFEMGPCPKVNFMNIDDLSKFEGTWYTAQKVNSFLDNGKCISHNVMNVMGAGYVITTTVTDAGTNVKTSLIGGGVYVGKLLPSSPGQVMILYPTAKFPSPIPINVINTDYVNYIVAYSCVDCSVAHITHAWILTRQKNPTDAVLAKAYADLDNAKISRTSFKVIDQSCTA